MLRQKIMAAAIGMMAFLPMTAEAATVNLVNGGLVSPVVKADLYIYEEVLAGGGGAVTRSFDFAAAAIDLPLGLLASNLTLTGTGTLTGAFMSWFDGTTTQTVALAPLLGIGYGASLTTLLTTTAVSTLSFGWTASTGGRIQVSMQVAAVPLPAGGLLLLGGLGGLVALRRRRKSA